MSWISDWIYESMVGSLQQLALKWITSLDWTTIAAIAVGCVFLLMLAGKSLKFLSRPPVLVGCLAVIGFGLYWLRSNVPAVPGTPESVATADADPPSREQDDADEVSLAAMVAPEVDAILSQPYWPTALAPFTGSGIVSPAGAGFSGGVITHGGYGIGSPTHRPAAASHSTLSRTMTTSPLAAFAGKMMNGVAKQASALTGGTAHTATASGSHARGNSGGLGAASSFGSTKPPGASKGSGLASGSSFGGFSGNRSAAFGSQSGQSAGNRHASGFSGSGRAGQHRSVRGGGGQSLGNGWAMGGGFGSGGVGAGHSPSHSGMALGGSHSRASHGHAQRHGGDMGGFNFWDPMGSMGGGFHGGGFHSGGFGMSGLHMGGHAGGMSHGVNHGHFGGHH
jgi:hypothetical protein